MHGNYRGQGSGSSDFNSNQSMFYHQQAAHDQYSRPIENMFEQFGSLRVSSNHPSDPHSNRPPPPSSLLGYDAPQPRQQHNPVGSIAPPPPGPPTSMSFRAALQKGNAPAPPPPIGPPPSMTNRMAQGQPLHATSSHASDSANYGLDGTSMSSSSIKNFGAGLSGGILGSQTSEQPPALSTATGSTSSGSTSDRKDGPSGDSHISDTASSMSREEEYPPELHDIALLRKICGQVEHYLSDEYLSTDKYLLRQLRSKSEGYLSVKLLTSFKKIKKQTRNWRVTSAALKLSTKLILSPDGCRVRRLDELPENLRRCRTMTSVLCIRVPDNWANLETVSELFSPFGNITLARILKPGKPIPTDLRNYATQIPDMGRTCCAVVEFSNCDSAHQSCRILRDRNLHGMRIALLGPRIRRTLYKPEKKKVPGGSVIGSSAAGLLGITSAMTPQQTAALQAIAAQAQFNQTAAAAAAAANGFNPQSASTNQFIRQLLQNPQGLMSAAAAVLAQQQQQAQQNQQAAAAAAAAAVQSQDFNFRGANNAFPGMNFNGNSGQNGGIPSMIGHNSNGSCVLPQQQHFDGSMGPGNFAGVHGGRSLSKQAMFDESCGQSQNAFGFGQSVSNVYRGKDAADQSALGTNFMQSMNLQFPGDANKPRGPANQGVATNPQQRQNVHDSSSHEGSSSESGVQFEKSLRLLQQKQQEQLLQQHGSAFDGASFLGALQSVVDNIIQSDPDDNDRLSLTSSGRQTHHSNATGADLKKLRSTNTGSDNQSDGTSGADWSAAAATGYQQLLFNGQCPQNVVGSMHGQQVPGYAATGRPPPESSNSALASIFDNSSIWTAERPKSAGDNERGNGQGSVMKSLWSGEVGQSSGATTSIW